MRLRASCRLLASYFCKGAHRTGSRCPVEGIHRPGSRCKYTGAHRPGSWCTGTRRPSSRCVPIGARGSRHTSSSAPGAYSQVHIQLHRCPQACLKAYRCPQTRLQLRCTQTRLQLHRYLQVPASSAPDARVPAGYLHTASQLQGRPGPKSGVSSRPKNLPYCSHACLDSWCEGSSSVRWSWVKQHACSHCFTASAEGKRRSGYLSGSRVLFTLCVHCQKIDACVPQVAVV